MSTAFVKLALLSLVLSCGLQLAHLPGALMFGPLSAAVVFSNSNIKIPKLVHTLSQALIGCLVARAFTPVIFVSFTQHWPVFLSTVMLTIIASCGLGWVFCKFQIFPGTTAVWGLLPGAATVMIIMSEQFQADVRLVAFMQYLRVVFVGLVASVVGLLAAHVAPMASHSVVWFAPIRIIPFAETMSIALLGVFAGSASRLPAGTLLLPLLLGGFAQCSGLLSLELPQWLLALAYAVIGWSVGLKFTKEALSHTVKILPQTVIAIFLMIVFCGGLSFFLTRVLGVDPLTAYLSTSPGGMDSIAIIAASSTVDMPFVMTLQTIRFLVVLFLGPTASKFVATRLLNFNPVLIEIPSSIELEMLKQIQEDESDLD